MNIPIFLRGLIVGFSIAAPVGPIGVLCIRRAISDGRLNSFISGLGAASADAIYGSVAAFGLTFITSILLGQQLFIKIVGGFFLCYLGIQTFLKKPAEIQGQSGSKNLVGAYLSTFFLTLTNPMTILSFVGVFAGLGLVEKSQNYLQAGLLVLGVFIGSGLWWFTLSSSVSLLRKFIDQKLMVWVNRLSGSLITGLGLLALWTLYPH